MNNYDSQLDATISALQGGLTSVPLSAAADVISQWEQTLSGAGLGDAASLLGDLRSELSGGAPNGQRIGSLLSQLGSATSSSASSASGATASKLQQLGSLLTQAGGSLA